MYDVPPLARAFCYLYTLPLAFQNVLPLQFSQRAEHCEHKPPLWGGGVDVLFQADEKLFIDKASGKNTDRAAFKEMMGFVRAGDIVVGESISRIARNTMYWALALPPAWRRWR